MTGDRHGFTLIELLIAMVVSGLLAGVATGVLLFTHRSFTRQMERADHDAVLRQASAFFSAEFRGLDSGDSVSSDLERIAAESIIYKPVRTVRFLCRRPDTLTGILTTWEAFWGVRDIRPEIDSIQVMLWDYSGEHWSTASVVETRAATCPEGYPGVAVATEGLAAPQLRAVPEGAPLLGRETVEVRSYRDGRGEWWVGMRRFQRASARWPSIQPVLGPLSPGGFGFMFHGSDGRLVTNHTDVARIRVRISLRTADPMARWLDRESTIDVALRGRGGR